MEKTQKLNFFIIIIYSSLIIGYLFGEDAIGGAYNDYTSLPSGPFDYGKIPSMNVSQSINYESIIDHVENSINHGSVWLDGTQRNTDSRTQRFHTEAVPP